MNKAQFLSELEKLLYGLPQEDIKQSLDYYSEIIDDRIEDGLSEYDAIAAMASPQEIAKQILMDIPLPKLVRAKAKTRHALRAWEIVLLVLGSPIWLSLSLAAVAVVISVYIVLWSIIISLYAVSASLLACGVAGILSFVVFGITGDVIPGVFIAGAGFVCIGFSIFMFMTSNLVTKGLLWVSKKIWISIKSCFIRKGDINEKI